METKKRLPRYVLWWVVPLHILWLATWCILCYVPTISQQAGGVCHVECNVRLCVASDNGDTLYLPMLQPDTASPELCIPLDTFVRCTADAFFVGYDGSLLVSAEPFPHLSLPTQSDSIRGVLIEWQDHLRKVARNLRHQVGEMQYYSRTHTVDDDGYSQAMDYFTYIQRQSDLTDSLLHRLDTLIKANHLRLEAQSDWSVYVPHAVSQDSLRLAVYSAHPTGNAHGAWLMLRVDAGKLPDGAYAFVPSPYVFHHQMLDEHLRIYTLSPFRGYATGPDSIYPQVLPCSLHQDLKGVADGAPVTNVLGQLAGVCKAGKMIPSDSLKKVIRSVHPSWLGWYAGQAALRLWHLFAAPLSPDDSCVVRYVSCSYPLNVGNPWQPGTQFSAHVIRDGMSYYGQWQKGHPHGWGVMQYGDSAYHVGHWRDGLRDGQGTYVRSVPENLISRCWGIWEADTLPYGRQLAATDSYTGGFDASGRADGYGIMTRYGGAEYYQGEYRHGLRHGLGMYVSEKSTCQLGAWHDGKFRGERMLNAAHRVYGIDISRYQHEVGRHTYPILWKKLRIKLLDRTAQRRIKGEESYPVDFIFIKSTQGTSIVNRYYKEDAAAARRYGIPTGAYHFFSPTGGKEQAEHFLKHTRYIPGDLPPVLDLELSDEQIRKMGGVKRMFAEVENWITIVHRHTGVRPILYISQDYTNRYMPEAPSALRECDVWIARYSQYKPYVHTLIWQLSPWGKVEGIQGDVDINVWNGSRPQFQEYVRSLK